MESKTLDFTGLKIPRDYLGKKEGEILKLIYADTKENETRRYSRKDSR